MPINDFFCNSCNTKKEVLTRNNEDVNCSCGSVMEKELNRNININYKGWSGWTNKNQKEDLYRNRRSEYLGRKQKERDVQKAIPNVNGEVFDSWKEAKNYAKEKGYRTEGYDYKINEEK